MRMESCDISPCIFYLAVSGQPHAPAGLFCVKVPWYPVDRRLGRPQNRSGYSSGETIPATARDRTQIVQPVASEVMANKTNIEQVN